MPETHEQIMFLIQLNKGANKTVIFAFSLKIRILLTFDGENTFCDKFCSIDSALVSSRVRFG